MSDKTGAYVRIMRNGKWQNLDITELSDTELRNFFQSENDTKLLNWAIFLAGFIRDSVGVTP
jgi:hypothetical protein